MGFSKQEYWNGSPCPPPGEAIMNQLLFSLSCHLTPEFVFSVTFIGVGHHFIVSWIFYNKILLWPPFTCIFWVIPLLSHFVFLTSRKDVSSFERLRERLSAWVCMRESRRQRDGKTEKPQPEQGLGLSPTNSSVGSRDRGWTLLATAEVNWNYYPYLFSHFSHIFLLLKAIWGKDKVFLRAGSFLLHLLWWPCFAFCNWKDMK